MYFFVRVLTSESWRCFIPTEILGKQEETRPIMLKFPWLTAWLLTVAQGGAKRFDEHVIFERQPVGYQREGRSDPTVSVLICHIVMDGACFVLISCLPFI